MDDNLLPFIGLTAFSRDDSRAGQQDGDVNPYTVASTDAI
jgi:hypothetical protein